MNLRRGGCLVAWMMWFALATHPAHAYSVLSHEEVVDMAWPRQIVPMLRARFPGLTDDQLREAHAYAYGGSVIQDIGYYPFGSHYFSDLLHYVRPGDFVEALLRDATTADEYAFALGGLAHYCGDAVGHPYVNEVVSAENPGLRKKFGRVVTYSEDPLAHVRTEFGFDVVEVAHGIYSQENYRDFIGFQVAKPLLERAFQETYGLPMDHVVVHEDLAIASYRRAVSSLIPKMTKVAWVSYHDEIERARPGYQRDKFVYRLRRTDYTQQYGHTFKEPGWGTHVLAFFLRLLPKIGPLKSLAVKIPDSGEQSVYLKSVNETVDRYHFYLYEMGAPEPTAGGQHPVLVRSDPAQGAASQAAEAPAQIAVDEATAKAHHVTMQAGTPEPVGSSPNSPGLPAAASPVQPMPPRQAGANGRPGGPRPGGPRPEGPKPDGAAGSDAAHADPNHPSPPHPGPGGPSNGGPPPSRMGPNPTAIADAIVASQDIHLPVLDGVPELPPIDLDTGQPSASGEYPLADQTMARLLDQVLHDSKATLSPDLRGTLLAFYENPVGRNRLSHGIRNHKAWRKLRADLMTLRSTTPGFVMPPPRPRRAESGAQPGNKAALEAPSATPAVD